MNRVRSTVLYAVFILQAASFTQAQAPGTVKWTLKTWSKYSSPAVDASGTVYVSANDGNLVAVNPDGTVKWKCRMGDASQPADAITSPAIDWDGTICSGSTWSGHGVFRVSPDGILLGQVLPNSPPLHLSSPAIGYDGSIVAGFEGTLDVFAPPDYARRWTATIPVDWPMFGQDPIPSPSIGQDGTIYIPSGDGTLKALSSRGHGKWAFQYQIQAVPNQIGDYGYLDARASVAIGDDGTVYFGANNTKLYALKPDGSPKWQVTTEGGIWSEPVIGPDGTIYVNSGNQKLYAFNPNGSQKWAFALAGTYTWLLSSPAVGSDGTIYIGTAGVSGKRAVAVNPDGTLQWQNDVDGSIFASPAIGPDGTVYFQTNENTLYAFYSSSEGLADSPWPKYRGGASNTGRARQNPRVAWQFDTGSNIQWSSPALADDGTVYIGSSSDSLIALNPDGKRQWAYATDGPIIASPVVGPDSTVIVGSTDSLLHAVNPDGTGKWTYRAGGQIISSPAVFLDGTVVVGSLDHKLHAVNRDGTPKWTFETGSTVYSSPVIGNDSTVYFGGDDRNFYALRPDGSEKWRFTAGGGIGTSAAIDTDGTLVFGCGDNQVYALNPNGTEKWHYAASWNIWSSPAIASDGTIIVGLRENRLLALNRDGTERWTLAVPGQIWSSPLVGADNRVYVGCHDGGVYAVTMDGDVEWTVFTGGEVWSSPNMSLDGILYIGSRDGWLYAIRTESGGLADAPWPKFRRNTRNSGSVQAAGEEEPPVNPPEPGDILWTYGDERSGFFSCPAVGPDGTIYAGSADSTLVALHPDGTEKWARKLDRAVLEPVALAADGTVYAAASDMLVAADSLGTLKWTLEGAAGKKFTSPSVGPDGALYTGSEDGHVYAFGPDGSDRWSYSTGDSILFAPVIGTGGTVYAASGDTLIALRRDGTPKWAFGTVSDITGAPAIGPDGTVYVGTDWNPRDNTSALFAIRPDGSMRYAVPGREIRISNGPVLSPDGATLYYGDHYGGLNALRSDDGGEPRSVQLNNSSAPVLSTPAVGPDGTIYAGSGNQFYIALNPALETVWSVFSGYAVASPALTPDSSLILAAGRLTALRTGTGGPFSGAWFKIKGNPANTGCLFGSGVPVAAVTADTLHALPGGTVLLDGSLSYDPDSDPISCSWQCLEKPEGTSVLISRPSSASADARIEKHGIYRFRLTVSDGSDGSSICDVTVHCGLKWAVPLVQKEPGVGLDLNLQHPWLSSPAVGQDGTVYVGSPFFGDRLHALNPDGTLRWALRHGEFGKQTSPVIGGDGTVYFEGAALRPDGSSLWVQNEAILKYMNQQTPALGPDSVLYWGFMALRGNGSMKWAYTPSDDVIASDPVIGSDGTVYFGSWAYTTPELCGFFALRPDSTIRWTFGLGKTFTPPILGSDGAIYTSGSDSTLYALNPEGTVRWTYRSSAAAFLPLVIGLDGTVYTASSEGCLLANLPDGSLDWSYDAHATVGGAALGSDGRIYLSAGNGLRVLDPDGTECWSYPFPGEMVLSHPAIAPDGTVYVGANDGYLYAFYTESRGLADSPWPKFHRDNRNTGCAPAAMDTNAVRPGDPDGVRQRPDRFALLPNHPNPFNPETTIGFGLPRASEVRLEIYNALGQRVRVLLEGRRDAGWHSVTWDGRDGTGQAVLSGIYIARIHAGRFTASRKMMLMK